MPRSHYQIGADWERTILSSYSAHKWITLRSAGSKGDLDGIILNGKEIGLLLIRKRRKNDVWSQREIDEIRVKYKRGVNRPMNSFFVFVGWNPNGMDIRKVYID